MLGWATRSHSELEYTCSSIAIMGHTHLQIDQAVALVIYKPQRASSLYDLYAPLPPVVGGVKLVLAAPGRKSELDPTNHRRGPLPARWSGRDGSTRPDPSSSHLSFFLYVCLWQLLPLFFVSDV